jgi:membrane fusion protein (multidrug efflux system)
VEIRVREGDIVKHGDALLAIGRKKGADALIVSLQEELKKEEDNLRRVRQLVEFEALPGEQLDQARSVCENVRAQLVKAEETLRDYVISAPWNGVASRLLVKEGEFVAPRAPLLEMYDPASLVILAAVPEKHATKVTTELRVDVRLDAYPGEIMEGRIERIYPYLDPRLRTRTIEISLDKSIDLLPGMFARLKVRMQKIDDAVVVPVGALIERPKGRIVFVVEDGKAVARSVETGIEEDNVIQIVSGVQPGDKIIIAGHEKLKNGTAVSLAEDVKAAGKGGSQTSPINEKKQNAAEPSAAPSTKEMNKAKGDTQ